MWVLMLQPSARDDVACRSERLNDCLVGVTFLAFVVNDTLAFKGGSVCGESTILIDGIWDCGADTSFAKLPRVVHPDVKIFAAMSRRSVYKPGTCIICDVASSKKRHVKVITLTSERMSAD